MTLPQCPEKKICSQGLAMISRAASAQILSRTALRDDTGGYGLDDLPEQLRSAALLALVRQVLRTAGPVYQ
jgi:hypothetical protein